MANATSKQQPKITPATKVAAIIIALGADSASEVYKYLRDEEIEEITSEISRIDLLSSDDMKEIIKAENWDNKDKNRPSFYCLEIIG